MGKLHTIAKYTIKQVFRKIISKDHRNIPRYIPDICTSIIQQILRFSGHRWRKNLFPMEKHDVTQNVDQLMEDIICDVKVLKTMMEIFRDEWK